MPHTNQQLAPYTTRRSKAPLHPQAKGIVILDKSTQRATPVDRSQMYRHEIKKRKSPAIEIRLENSFHTIDPAYQVSRTDRPRPSQTASMLQTIRTRDGPRHQKDVAMMQKDVATPQQPPAFSRKTTSTARSSSCHHCPKKARTEQGELEGRICVVYQNFPRQQLAIRAQANGRR